MKMALLALALSGCASVFDAQAPFEATPVLYINPNSKQPVICYYEHDGTAWLMRRQRSECIGWTPI